MGRKKIVAKFKDGSNMKGVLVDFSPDKTILKLIPANGEIQLIETEKLKAVFFVKDFQGSKKYNDKYKDANPWAGKKIQLHFNDGEIIIGYTLHYDLGNQGFFVTPADGKSNNDNIFVIVSAINKITFL